MYIYSKIKQTSDTGGMSMPLLPQVENFLKRVADLQKSGIPTIENLNAGQIRQLFNRFHEGTSGQEEQVADIKNLTIPGDQSEITVRLYTPSGNGPFPVLVYFHGGGWVAGNLETADFLVRKLANKANCLVVSVNYRLAPEHKFPAAVKDCYTAVKWTAAHIEKYNGDPRRMVTGGDGAGGNLAAVIPIIAKEQGGPSISFQLLIYPVTNLSFNTPSHKHYASGYFLEHSAMKRFAAEYLNHDEERTNYYVSPLMAKDLSGLPPALIITAEYDILRDEGEEYARRLREAGVKSQLIRYDGLIHGFLTIPELKNEAKLAVEHIAVVLKRHFSSGE